MSIRERITKLADKWFLMEPAFFDVYCSHNVVENLQMKCPIRCGKGMIEYNSNLIEKVSDSKLEDMFKAEAIRILLKHPYCRQPDDCCNEAKTMGSNCVLSDGYDFRTLKLDKPSDFNLNGNECYEYYAMKIQKMMPPGYGSDYDDSASSEKSNSLGKGNKESLSDQSDEWQEDDLMSAEINGMINRISEKGGWGSMPSDMVDVIKASTKVKIDYRKVLSGFRASILSSNRKLTRMRPNRRTGFDNMGSLYKMQANLLVAVDVSGSISNDDLKHFFGVINRFFKHGINTIDVVQFDVRLGEVKSMKKASPEIQVQGRGGTCFQPVIDYAAESKYDGLIFFTDGYAAIPVIPVGFRTKIVWVCTSELEYEKHKKWMEKLGRACFMEF